MCGLEAGTYVDVAEREAKLEGDNFRQHLTKPTTKTRKYLM